MQKDSNRQGRARPGSSASLARSLVPDRTTRKVSTRQPAATLPRNQRQENTVLTGGRRIGRKREIGSREIWRRECGREIRRRE
eukprot:901275-Rhodomonas_salina.1